MSDNSETVDDPVIEANSEDLREMKQEPPDENDIEDLHCYVKQERYGECETEGQCFSVQVSFYSCQLAFR